jgi:hypothetical protein
MIDDFFLNTKKGKELKVPHYASVAATRDGNLPLVTAIYRNLPLFLIALLIIA